MDAAASTPSPAEFAFTLSISCEPAFADAVRALASRAGALAGCSDEHSARLGACLGGVFDALIAGGATHATDIDLAVHGSPRLVTIDVQCPRACGPVVAGAAETPALRALVDRLECGETGGRAFCRVTQQVHA
jgi:hypothetical protein